MCKQQLWNCAEEHSRRKGSAQRMHIEVAKLSQTEMHEARIKKLRQGRRCTRQISVN